ncbi:MAG: glycosyltransferase family 2 protein [Thermoleophilia bacterium]|nr:glycosyltransferase family 2 protein [Thermoleophilia bacterium]
MTISVVIPLYNKASHIRRAIDSVLAQSISDVEIVVVDDGSTDGGADAVRGISDPRIKLVAQQNAGESAARNRGIQEASSPDLIAFLDADDEWMPTFLETVTNLRARYPEAGMYGTSFVLRQDDRQWRPTFKDCVDVRDGGLLEDFFRAAAWNSPICSSAVMVPRHVFDEVGMFPMGVKRGGDMHMWTRIALAYRVAWSPIDGAVYHLSAENRAVKTISAGADVPEASVIEEFLSSGRRPLGSRHTLEEYLASRRLANATEAYLRGDRVETRSLLALTQGTSRFRWWRLRLRLALLIPPGFVPFTQALRRSARRLGGER